jgi:hypothetical protein
MNEWLEGRINVTSVFVFPIIGDEIYSFGSLASKGARPQVEIGRDNLQIWRVNTTKDKK